MSSAVHLLVVQKIHSYRGIKGSMRTICEGSHVVVNQSGYAMPRSR